jgi:hypothetical protein
MRKVMVFVLAAVLLVGVSYALAQESSAVTPPKPGDQPSSMAGPGSMTPPQLMQQMQDTMQQMQTMMRKPKTSSADMKQLQDMISQMQSMMNQMKISYMMQMCGSCPMMKQGQQPSSMPPSSPPPSPSGQPEPEKKP